MNKNEKRWIVLLVAVVIIAIVLFVALGISKNRTNQGGQAGGDNNSSGTENVVDNTYVTEQSDGTRLNNSTNFNSVKKYGDLEISVVNFYERNGSTVLIANAKNVGSSAHKIETVKITILGENDQVLAESNAVISDIEPGAESAINVTFTADVVNAKDFKITAAE